MWTDQHVVNTGGYLLCFPLDGVRLRSHAELDLYIWLWSHAESHIHRYHRPVARGGGSGGGGGRTTPPQLPIPKILFHPLAILFHSLAILFHLSAILFHPSAILFHPLAILFHPWNMWMTSHGQCPRGGVLVNVQEWGRFSN